MTLPVVKRKVVEKLYRKDGRIQYLPHVVFTRKFLGLIKYPTTMYLIGYKIDGTMKYGYILREPSGFASIDADFVKFESEEDALYALSGTINKYLRNRQQEINRTIVKVTKKVFNEK